MPGELPSSLGDLRSQSAFTRSEHDPLKHVESDLWLESPLLRAIPRLVHGFTVRAAGDMGSDGTRRVVLDRVGATRLRLLKQVHSGKVSRADDPAERPEADGWVGRTAPGVLLGILTADCLPVLLCHPRSCDLALVHAGWRGAASQIVRTALKAMSAPADEVVSVLGPCIGPCCYEVGEDVARAVGGDSPHLGPWREKPDKYAFDIPGLVRSQLEDEGVSSANIHTISLCTSCRPDLFFSYRREGRTGRMAAFLGWANRGH